MVVSLSIWSCSNSNLEMEILMDVDVKCADTDGLSIMFEQSITDIEPKFSMHIHAFIFESNPRISFPQYDEENIAKEKNTF